MRDKEEGKLGAEDYPGCREEGEESLQTPNLGARRGLRLRKKLGEGDGD